jgi:lysyl-tRNA synthetase class 2
MATDHHAADGAASMPPSPDFLPTASLTVLQERSLLLAAIRDVFAEEGYWEVETPLLSRDVCVDAWLDPFPVNVSGSGDAWYLQTSPEFGMKRLLAAGAKAIYQLTRSFRSGEAGARHNPEFTILEWYRVGDSHFQQMDFTERLVRRIWDCDLGDNVARPVLPKAIPRLTYDDAFEKFTGSKVLKLTEQELVALGRRHGLALPSGI